ncbi:acyl-CoA thioesterase [Antarctobacter jejuensis]|uniref:acyl-CoA thioesterase n=1 Tax=Antarctobacter jejuensis TaxID=1439938 RepID=UPI003FCFCF92
MYPFIRLARNLWLARRAPKLGVFDTQITEHVCLPWDLDPWVELNNGRTLTIYDLGRIPLAVRTGLVEVLRRERWGLTIAGSVVRYRRRVRMWDRVTMHSRVLGWDNRFLYIDQSMWRTDGECASHAVFRSAITDKAGIVATDRIAAALNVAPESPPLPDWVQDWIAAEAARPWPPAKSG